MQDFGHWTISPLRKTRRAAMKCPVEPPAEIGLGYLGGQLNKLGVRKMIPQSGDQFIADV
jgi:hypothetical protein